MTPPIISELVQRPTPENTGTWDAGFALKLEGIYFEKMLYRTSPSRFTPSEEKLI
jgi:hypothetical protein